jgi:hypothetical protein
MAANRMQFVSAHLAGCQPASTYAGGGNSAWAKSIERKSLHQEELVIVWLRRELTLIPPAAEASSQLRF